MRVIPVLDIAGGVAVHASGGKRTEYAPVRSVLSPVEGDIARLAGAYRDALGLKELYVADLDAITRGEPPSGIVRLLARSGVRIWLDAGVSDAGRARSALEAGASMAIVGLETLPSIESLEEMVASIGTERLAFSLDLREGVPVRASARSTVALPGDPVGVAELAAARGVNRIVVLDLARVGAERGAELTVTAAIRARLPDVELIVGGGVRDWTDLQALASAGCDAVLVGTALHQGRIGATEIARLREQDRTDRGEAPRGER